MAAEQKPRHTILSAAVMSLLGSSEYLKVVATCIGGATSSLSAKASSACIVRVAIEQSLKIWPCARCASTRFEAMSLSFEYCRSFVASEMMFSATRVSQCMPHRDRPANGTVSVLREPCLEFVSLPVATFS